MNSELLTRVALRRQQPEDESFLLLLYGSTRREELDKAELSEPFREAFLSQQYMAMTQGYRARFGDASWSIIELDGRAVGRVIVQETPSEVRVVDLALVDEVRGLGIGSWLVRNFQISAQTQRKPVRLRAFLGSRAEKWYRRLGFSPIEDDGLRVHLEWGGSAGGNPP